MTDTESTPTADSTACLCPADHDVRGGHTDACEAAWEMAYHAAERDRLNAEADAKREIVAVARDRGYPTLAQREAELRRLIAERDRHSSAWRRLRAAQPVKGDSNDEGVCPICDEVHELFFDDLRMQLFHARIDRSRAVELISEIEGGRLAVARAERDRAVSLISDLEDAIASAEADEQDCNHDDGFSSSAPDASQVPHGPTPFDERALAETDAILDMTGMAVTSTAAVLAIRALMDGKRELAVNAWAAVQHGKRGERWAAARERAAVLAEVVQQIDTVIAERMS
jgi:hypothetical protein